MVTVSLHMALGGDKTDNTQDFFYLNKLEIAERMYKICIFVIVLGLGAPMVSLHVLVQERVTVRTTRHTSDLPEYLAHVSQNPYPVDKAIPSWFTVYLTFIRCR